MLITTLLKIAKLYRTNLGKKKKCAIHKMVTQSQKESPENIYTSTIIQTEQDEYRYVCICVYLCV